MTNGNGNGKAKWIAIGLPLLVAIVGVLGFIYGIGQRGGKIAEVVDWKGETAPRIERMDAKGTNSFEIFHEEYLRTQKRQEDELERLRQEIHDKQMADIKERLLTLERKP
jgi:hypothetical protein